MIIDTIYLIRATAETQEGLQPEYMNKFLICFMMMEWEVVHSCIILPASKV